MLAPQNEGNAADTAMSEGYPQYRGMLSLSTQHMYTGRKTQNVSEDLKCSGSSME